MLHFEDDPEDTVLIRSRLEKEGIESAVIRVETLEEDATQLSECNLTSFSPINRFPPLTGFLPWPW
jgi:hypothetical protein